MQNLLDINSPVIFDESITNWKIESHTSYGPGQYNNNDEIHIGIQHQDQCLVPGKSKIHIQGTLTQHNGNPQKDGAKPANNAICTLFSEICYELNTVPIDVCKNVGLTSLMKAYPSLNFNQLKYFQLSGWGSENLIDNKGNFDVMIPLSMIISFAEDYQKRSLMQNMSSFL